MTAEKLATEKAIWNAAINQCARILEQSHLVNKIVGMNIGGIFADSLRAVLLDKPELAHASISVEMSISMPDEPIRKSSDPENCLHCALWVALYAFHARGSQAGATAVIDAKRIMRALGEMAGEVIASNPDPDGRKQMHVWLAQCVIDAADKVLQQHTHQSAKVH